jgi:hypothetical protein
MLESNLLTEFSKQRPNFILFLFFLFFSLNFLHIFSLQKHVKIFKEEKGKILIKKSSQLFILMSHFVILHEE